jgi:hypothetical protein
MPLDGAVVGAYPDPGLDATHATAQLTRLVASQYVDKTSGDVDRLMTHFSKELLFYADATVGGLSVGWAAGKTAYESFLPPAGSGAVS